MLGLFAVIKDKIKPKFGSHCIDNWVFQLHYRATTIIFLIATILVTSREYVGEHIKCISNMHADGFSKVVETFCFFTSTFTVISDHKYGAGQIAHPGVHPYGIESTQPVKKHFYYQWVPFLLFGQAIMFYLTHLLWKKLEGGRIDKLVAGLDNSAFALLDKTMQVENRTIPTKEEKNACISRIKNAFLQRIILNKSWARWFIFCEILNVLNVVFQAYITHLFLG
ncbi:Innexin domain containing protein, partial [Asbolus verrucosus]